MIDTIEKSICTGCNACYNICPQQAITMISDKEGFLYPNIDNGICDNCDLCEKACPPLINYGSKTNYDKPDIYASWSLSEETRIHSTSGGIFSELAKSIFNIGGHVVGAKYTKHHAVEHCIVSNIDGLTKLRQSKYAQSDIGLVYKKVKKLLIDSETVLFCGTPCHNAALSSYLNKRYDNLILCDFVCRGVPSPKVYMKYLEMLKIKYKSEIEQVIFKNKTYGWNKFSTLIKFINGKHYIKDRYHDLFMVGYLKHNFFLRPSCYDCRFKKLPRVSDITLGDFWGIGKTRPHLDENKGTSLIFINSIRGKIIFENIKDRVFSEKCKLEEALNDNPCIFNSVASNKKRDRFFEDLDIMPFEKLMKKYGSDKFNYKVMTLLIKTKRKLLKYKG